MYEVYGQTECTGIATANTSKDNRVGSVGRATDKTEIVLSEDRRFLIKGQASSRDIGINLKRQLRPLLATGYTRVMWAELMKTDTSTLLTG